MPAIPWRRNILNDEGIPCILRVVRIGDLLELKIGTPFPSQFSEQRDQHPSGDGEGDLAGYLSLVGIGPEGMQNCEGLNVYRMDVARRGKDVAEGFAKGTRNYLGISVPRNLSGLEEVGQVEKLMTNVRADRISFFRVF